MAGRRMKRVSTLKSKPKSTFKKAPPEEFTPQASLPKLLHLLRLLRPLVSLILPSKSTGSPFINTSVDFDFRNFTVRERKAVEKVA